MSEFTVFYLPTHVWVITGGGVVPSLVTLEVLSAFSSSFAVITTGSVVGLAVLVLLWEFETEKAEFSSFVMLI